MTFRHFSSRFRRFLVASDGPTAVEYAVMLAAILLVALAAIGALGAAVGDSFGDSNAKLAPHMTGS
ncbi:MAG TPA: Flp family type IVb pilin [Pirellulaceae bacterium]|jgi:pilus assembly protein Flp/PilA|nr:Flp family type IVb pilin [Pirellulaceae bacterium]